MAFTPESSNFQIAERTIVLLEDHRILCDITLYNISVMHHHALHHTMLYYDHGRGSGALFPVPWPRGRGVPNPCSLLLRAPFGPVRDIFGWSTRP